MRIGYAIVVLAALVLGWLLGAHGPSASAGPAVVPGNPTHWFVTNSENGAVLYVWAVTNGAVVEVSQNWIGGQDATDVPVVLRSKTVVPAPKSAGDR